MQQPELERGLGQRLDRRTRLANLDVVFVLRRPERELVFAVLVVAVGGDLVDVLALVERVGGDSGDSPLP